MHDKNTYFTFSMKLSSDEYQRYYSGTVHNIIVMTHQGVRVQFPASAVRNFVKKDGVNGDFVIIMDSNNKLVSLERLVA